MGIKNANKLLEPYISFSGQSTGNFDVFIDLNIMLFKGAVSEAINSKMPELKIACEAFRKTKMLVTNLSKSLKERGIVVTNVTGLCDGVKPPAKLQTQLSRPRKTWRVDLAMSYYLDFMSNFCNVIRLVKGEAELEAIKRCTNNSVIISDDTDIFIGAYHLLQSDSHNLIIYNSRLMIFDSLTLPKLSQLPFQLILSL